MYTTNDSIAVGEIHNALCLHSKVDHQMIKAVLFKVIPSKNLLTSLLLMLIWAILPMYVMSAIEKLFNLISELMCVCICKHIYVYV